MIEDNRNNEGSKEKIQEERSRVDSKEFQQMMRKNKKKSDNETHNANKMHVENLENYQVMHGRMKCL